MLTQHFDDASAWLARFTFAYLFSNHHYVSAGYKVRNVDYDRNGHAYDTRVSDPVPGMTTRF